MSLRAASHVLALSSLLTCALALGGCAASHDEGTEDDGALATAPPKTGAWAVSLPEGRKAVSVAMAGGKLYAGLNDTGGHVVVVDPATTKVLSEIATYDLAGKTGLRVPADDGITRDGNSLVFYGYANEGPGAQFQEVIAWFDPVTKKVTKEVRVELDKTIINPSSELVDRPRVSVAVSGGKVWVALRHDRASKLVSFEVPSAASSVVNHDGALFAAGTSIERYSKGLAVRAGAAYTVVASGAKDGYLVRVDLASGKSTKIAKQLGYPTRVSFDAGKLYVNDYNGALLTVDEATGNITKSDEVDDFLEDATFDADYAYLVTDSKFVVLARH